MPPQWDSSFTVRQLFEAKRAASLRADMTGRKGAVIAALSGRDCFRTKPAGMLM